MVSSVFTAAGCHWAVSGHALAAVRHHAHPCCRPSMQGSSAVDILPFKHWERWPDMPAGPRARTTQLGLT